MKLNEDLNTIQQWSRTPILHTVRKLTPPEFLVFLTAVPFILLYMLYKWMAFTLDHLTTPSWKLWRMTVWGALQFLVFMYPLAMYFFWNEQKIVIARICIAIRLSLP